MKIRSLVLKIVISMIAIDVISISIVTVLYYLQSKDALYNRAFIQLSQVKKIKYQQLNSYFGLIDNTLTSIADGELLNKKVTNGVSIEKFHNSEYFDSITIINMNSRSKVEYVNDSLAKIDSADLKKILLDKIDKPQIRELIDYRNRTFKLITIQDNNNLGVRIVADINIAEINRILSHDYKDSLIDKSIEAYMVGADGYLRTPSIFIPNAIMKAKYSRFGIEEIKQSFNSQSSIHTDYRGKKVLRVSEKLNIPNLNWVLLVEIDEDEVNAPFAQMWKNTLWVILLINIGISFLAYYFAKKLTRPIINLSRASKLMYDGNYPEPIEIEAYDEIGTLTDNFNQMVDRIQKQSDELEVERNKRLNAYILATELERKRLSSELHDGLGQSLIALKLQLECLEPDTIQDNMNILNNAKNLLNDSIDELRAMSNDLLPNVLSELGLLEAIKQMLNYCSNKPNLCVSLINNMINQYELNEKESVNIYRIIQEAVKNAITHSNAKNIELELSETTNEYLFQIRDDGKGFEPSNKKLYGNGLYNINERANLINAKVQITSDNSHGSEIKISKGKMK